jgi:hypothetical protein
MKKKQNIGFTDFVLETREIRQEFNYQVKNQITIIVKNVENFIDIYTKLVLKLIAKSWPKYARFE